MGRGERKQGSRSAAGLLFGQRGTAVSEQPRDYPSNNQISLALSRLRSGNSQTAIELVLRFADQQFDRQPADQQLVDELAVKIDNGDIGEHNWRRLINVLGRRLDSDQSVAALEKLQEAIGHEIIRRSSDRDGRAESLSADERHFLLEIDAPLSDRVAAEWAAHYPSEGLKLGLGHHQEYSEQKKLVLRRGAYRAARNNPERLPSWITGKRISPLIKDQVKADIANNQGQDLTAAVLASIEQYGGAHLFGRRDQDDPPETDYIFGRIVEATPESGQKIYRDRLRSYLTACQQSGLDEIDDLGQKLGLDKDGQEELGQALREWLEGDVNLLAERILAGRRSQVVGQERTKLGQIIASHIPIDNIDHLGNPNQIAKSEVSANLDQLWQQFEEKYPTRRLRARKHLNINQDDWASIISRSLINCQDNPYRFRLDRERLLATIIDWPH